MFNKQFGDEPSPLHFRFQAVVGGFAKVSALYSGCSPTTGKMVCYQIVDLDKASFAVLFVLSAARRLV